MKKLVLIFIGFVFLTIGAIGIFFPVLPTTPFVLVSAACFASSDKKLHDWLKKAKYFGAYIENYENKTGVPRYVKIHSLIFLWVMLIISAVIVSKMNVTIILSCVGLLVSLHISLLKENKGSINEKEKNDVHI